MKTRPSFINELDWNLLIKKYKGRKLEVIIKKIKNNYPVQYAIGNIEFIKSKILVNKNVLIPRFETELLVDKLIKYIKLYNLQSSNMIDLCTGSGCIAISLKKEFSDAYVLGIDKSHKALRVARKNAKLNKTSINYEKKNVLKKLKLKKRFSILVSNPPYVRLDEKVSLNTKFEPSDAIYPGKNDIIFYEMILNDSKNFLYHKNIIAFEIGSNQAERICKIAKDIYPSAKIIVEKDYNQFNRFIFIFNNCE